MRNYWSVDRIEGAYAVCENDEGVLQNFLLAEIPFHVAEGNVFYIENGVPVADSQEEKRRKQKAKELADRLFGKGK